MELWTALVLGFVGSFHCVGMCGPIAMSIPRSSNSFLGLTGSALIYNTGRILTYAVFGLLFGFLGTGITIGGFQGTLSIILGSSIILGVFFVKFFRRKTATLLQKPTAWVTSMYGKLLRKESNYTLFGLGVLNGLLPCAFVYSGLAAAVLTSSPVHSASYMALFGLGTFPAMFFMYLSPNILSQDLRQMIRDWIPYFAFTFGIVLILRGFILFDLYVPDAVSERVSSFCVFPGTTMD
ncbi:MAG: sulfite exporter TauE/SafE family protein [Balneolaceae bacterium]|nr:sulfite exporter TauE/SafE family protein [Balneolaceae bacterium]